jgi:hypothetical protein
MYLLSSRFIPLRIALVKICNVPARYSGFETAVEEVVSCLVGSPLATQPAAVEMRA